MIWKKQNKTLETARKCASNKIDKREKSHIELICSAMIKPGLLQHSGASSS